MLRPVCSLQKCLFHTRLPICPVTFGYRRLPDMKQLGGLTEQVGTELQLVLAYFNLSQLHEGLLILSN